MEFLNLLGLADPHELSLICSNDIISDNTIFQAKIVLITMYSYIHIYIQI